MNNHYGATDRQRWWARRAKTCLTLATIAGVCLAIVYVGLQLGVVGGWRFELVEEKIGTIVEIGQCSNGSKRNTCAWAARTDDGLIYRTSGSPKTIGQQIKITVYRDLWRDPDKLFFKHTNTKKVLYCGIAPVA